MIIRISGGSSGIGHYLEKGVKSGREQTRDELDERLILSGSIAELESILDTMGDCQSQKYLHVTLSFKEQDVSHDLLTQVSEEFKAFAFSATKQDEFYYYAEAHNPKIKTIIDKQGESHKRLPHIHAIIPQYNLTTGKKEDFLGNIAHITQYIDAFQEDVNERYQLESPKDNKRDITGEKTDIINRHKITPDMTRKQVRAHVLKIIEADSSIRSVDDLAQALSDMGKVTVRTNAKDGHYINLKFTEDKKAINLKDEAFKNAYLATRKIESQQVKNSPKAYVEMLEKWQHKAQEIRFIRPLGKKKREAYKQLSGDKKVSYLAEKMSAVQDNVKAKSTSISNQAELANDTVAIQAETPTIDQILYIDEMPLMGKMRHIDKIPPLIQETSIHEQARKHDYTSRNRRHHLYDVPRGADSTNQTESKQQHGDTLLTDKLPIDENLHLGRFKEIKAGQLQHMATDGTKHRQRTRQLDIDMQSNKSDWTHTINNTDMRVTIDYLSYHYGIDRFLQITKSVDGHDRIKEGNRNYTISDYMAKKLNLGWDEIKSALETINQQQELGSHAKSQVNSRITWQKFQVYESNLDGLSAVNARFRKEHKKILDKTRFQADETMKKSQAFAYRKMLSEQREDELKTLNERKQEEREYYDLKSHERYLKYLHQEAKKGDLLCLQELNRVYPMRDEDMRLSFVQKQRTTKRFSPMDIGANVSISKRGNVEYKDDTDRVIIEDKGNKINVKIKTTENIEKALELAKKRFGTDNFEITNATEKDLKAINEASKNSKTTITIKETPQMTIERGDSKLNDKREGWER